MSGLTDMRILIADDDAANLELLEQLLEDAGYEDLLSTPTDSAGALCSLSHPDLVVLRTADGSGTADTALLRELRADRHGLPVLLIGADAGQAGYDGALAVGGDFIGQPIDAAELRLRVRNLLQISKLRRTLERRNDVLDEAVRRRTLKVEQGRLEMLTILASVAEYHDDDTRQHAQRVGICAAMIAQALELPELVVARIRDAAPLHDLGKIGISRRVLLKPGKLTVAERENICAM